MEDFITLTQEESGLLAEYSKAIGEYQKAIADLGQQAQGALKLIVRQRQLKGSWNLDGGKLVKVPDGVE